MGGVGGKLSSVPSPPLSPKDERRNRNAVKRLSLAQAQRAVVAQHRKPVSSPRARFMQVSVSDGMPVGHRNTPSVPLPGCCPPKKPRVGERSLQHPEQPRASLAEPGPSWAAPLGELCCAYPRFTEMFALRNSSRIGGTFNTLLLN